jgi:anti-sigma-K factor RskA
VDVHELTAANALDAVDPAEREAYEAHLAQCERCRAELAELAEAAAALAYGASSPEPPAALRGRILAGAASERRNVVPLPLRRRWVAAAAAVAACAAVGFGVWSATLSTSLDAERAARAAEHRAMEIYMDPQSKRTALKDASGALAVEPTGQAMLLVHKLPPAPSGMTYEAWVIPPGSKPVRAGLFEGGEPMTMLALDENVPNGSLVAATVERDGGVDSPTASPVFTARA